MLWQFWAEPDALKHLKLRTGQTVCKKTFHLSLYSASERITLKLCTFGRKYIIGESLRQTFNKVGITIYNKDKPVKKKVSWASRAGCCWGWKRASKFQKLDSTKLLLGISVNLWYKKYYFKTEINRHKSRVKITDIHYSYKELSTQKILVRQYLDNVPTVG